MAQGTQSRVWRRVRRLDIIGLMAALFRRIVGARLRHAEPIA